MRKSWNATRFIEGGRRETSQHALRVLWAEDRFVRFDLETGPFIEFRTGCGRAAQAWGGLVGKTGGGWSIQRVNELNGESSGIPHTTPQGVYSA